jgi:hypothetical protein
MYNNYKKYEKSVKKRSRKTKHLEMETLRLEGSL